MTEIDTNALRTIVCDRCGASPGPVTDGFVRCGACGRELGELVTVDVLVRRAPPVAPGGSPSSSSGPK